MIEITLCRHCDTRVVPSAAGGCPSCGNDVHSEPTITRKKITVDDEEKLLSKYQALLNGRRFIFIGMGLDLFNTITSCLRENANAVANLTAGVALASLLGLFAWHLTRSLNKLRATLAEVTTN